VPPAPTRHHWPWALIRHQWLSSSLMMRRFFAIRACELASGLLTNLFRSGGMALSAWLPCVGSRHRELRLPRWATASIAHPGTLLPGRRLARQLLKALCPTNSRPSKAGRLQASGAGGDFRSDASSKSGQGHCD